MKRLIKDEKGAAMLLAVILLLVGGLIVASLLSYMGTGLLVGPVYEGRVAELYGADAGVEDAVWRIQHQADVPTGCAQDTTRSYNITDVNGREVEFSISRANNVTLIYQIVSTATSDDGSSTTVEADVELIVLDLLSGALVSSGNIDFSGGCTVAGDVYYVGDITGKEYEHINGVEAQIPLSAFPTQEENVEFAQQFKEEAVLGGTYDGTMTIKSNTTLGPLYITGNLAIWKGVTVTLGGTIYVDGSIGSDKEYTVIGSGSIVAVGDINLHKMPDYGIEGDTIIMSLNGQIKFWKEANIEALVYAPNGSIDIEKDMTVSGGVIGAGINVKKDSSFTYVSKGSSFGFFDPVVCGARIKTYSISQN